MTVTKTRKKIIQTLNCPHCGDPIHDDAVLSAAASIQGKRSKRKLTKKDARAMQQKSVEARRRNKEDKT